MPIWSLTKERVEKLLNQIGDKELEIDALIKLSKEDLWKRDLDDFINEWRFQLEDEDKRQKKITKLGRRESRKLKIGAAKGPGGRKRKQSSDSDDSDFGGPAKKPTVSKAAIPKSAQPRQGLLSHLSPLAKANQPKPKPPKAPKATTEAKKEAAKVDEVAQPEKKASDDIWMNIDGPSELGSDPSVAPIFSKAKAAAAATKKSAPRKALESEDESEEDSIKPTITTKKSAPRKVLKSEDASEEEIIKPTAASRKPRAAATKPVKYSLQSDSDDSNGDDLLFDVGKMVKGIGNASGDQSSSSRPLFSTSMSRPGSNAGLPKKSSSSAKQIMDLDGDDTDYSKLVPPKKGTTVTANETVLTGNNVDFDDDDFDTVVPAPPPKKARPKPKEVPKTKTKPAPKNAPPPAPAKKLALSPAAKAYAAKQARNKKIVLDDDDEDDEDDEIEKVANEILDDDDGSDEGVPVAAARPSRRAVAAGKKKAWVLDDDDDESALIVDEGDTGSFEDSD